MLHHHVISSDHTLGRKLLHKQYFVYISKLIFFFQHMVTYNRQYTEYHKLPKWKERSQEGFCEVPANVLFNLEFEILKCK